MNSSFISTKSVGMVRRSIVLIIVLLLAVCAGGYTTFLSMSSAPSDAPVVSVTSPVEKWTTYQDDMLGFVFDHPTAVTLQPLHTGFSGVTNGVEGDVSSSYNPANSFQRMQKVYVGVTSDNSEVECVPKMPRKDQYLLGDFVKTIKVYDQTFSQYKRVGDCAMDGCSVGDIYRTWTNGFCYEVSSFAIQANPGKTYDPGDPKLDAALAAGKLASEKLADLTAQILATVSLREPQLPGHTPTWSWYADTKHGFTFAYPASYQLRTDFPKSAQTSDIPALASLSFNDPHNQEPVQKTMVVYLADEATTTTYFEEYLKKHPQHDANSGHTYAFSDFTQRTIGENTFYSIQTERFEGVLAFNYYTMVGNKVYLFQIISQGVDWTNPNLDVENEVGHAAFRQVLSTFKSL